MVCRPAAVENLAWQSGDFAPGDSPGNGPESHSAAGAVIGTAQFGFASGSKGAMLPACP
jgi:hypothetical protein